MAKIDYRPWIERMVEHFKKKPTWEMARHIWLHCLNKGLPVDPAVKEYFVTKLTEDNDIWLDRIGATLEDKQNSNIFTQQIAELRDNGLSWQDVTRLINDNFPDPEGEEDLMYTEAAIRSRYRRNK